ncbi:MAG: hypothetical protein ACE5D0_03100 [Fidelibacterota bacterium]
MINRILSKLRFPGICLDLYTNSAMKRVGRMGAVLNLIFIFILFQTGAHAQHQNRLFWDGGDWNRVSQLAAGDRQMEIRIKSAYLNGVLDGRLFFYLKIWSVEQGLADSVFAETIDYLSPKEMVRSLDNFYSDPLMVYVPVPSAMIVSNMYGERIPLKIIDAYVQQTKFWINDLQLRLEEQTPTELLEGKRKKHLEK